MKTELAPTSSDLSLLPRADLPVIWDGFKAKAEQLRTTAETLTVTSVEQKAEMELARTTRLTLKQIRVEVEKKRIELGEGHLTEIQKINKAAKVLKEMIEPLEGRLLHQELFAERVEADRVVELTKRRNDEVRAIWPGCPGDFGKMSETEYAALIARLRIDAATMAEAKRRQAEAEALAVREREAAEASRRQMQAQLDAQQAEAQRQARAAAAEAEIKIAAERAELQRKYEAARILAQQERAKEEASRAAQEELEKKERDAREAVLKAELEVEIAKQKEEQQALNTKLLELEVQLANERAAKLAEEERLRKLAVAPDLIKLRAYYDDLKDVPLPNLSTQDAERALIEAVKHVSLARTSLDIFCKRFEQG